MEPIKSEATHWLAQENAVFWETNLSPRWRRGQENQKTIRVVNASHLGTLGPRPMSFSECPAPW